MSLPFPFRPPEETPGLEDDGQPPILVDAWRLAEVILSEPDERSRLEALDGLLVSDGHRTSPLTILVLYHLLYENNAQIRAASVRGLAAVFARQDNTWMAAASSRQFASELLRGLRRDGIVALLWLLDRDATLASALVVLLDRTPNVSEVLVELVQSREAPLGLRLQSLAMLRQLGRIDALPALDEYERRLIGWRLGKLGQGFLAPKTPDEQALLAALQETITYLREDE